MPYKPKHCCQCGEKIDRITWKLWTSRRFCELCEIDFSVYDWTIRSLYGIAILLGVLGIGSIFQKPEKQLTVAANQFVGAANNNNVNVKNETPILSSSNNNLPTGKNNDSLAQSPTQAPPPPRQNLKNQPIESSLKAEPSEPVYFCGAQTKKGTLCSRRVKGGGRCWQHAGQPAMLPQDKLLAAK
jgi:hypothetical protein